MALLASRTPGGGLLRVCSGAFMSASKRGVLGRIGLGIARWLSANWAAKKTAVASVTVVAVPFEPVLTRPAPAVIVPTRELIASLAATHPAIEDAVVSKATPNHHLPARLAVVARLNAPSTRAVKRTPSTIPAMKCIPMPAEIVAKSRKLTTLPTTVAVRMLQRKAKPSAAIIDLATARRRAHAAHARRAA